MTELVHCYELAVFAWRDMADRRAVAGVDTGSLVRWELHDAAEALRAVGIREHELNEIQAAAIVKLAALRRLIGPDLLPALSSGPVPR